MDQSRLPSRVRRATCRALTAPSLSFFHVCHNTGFPVSLCLAILGAHLVLFLPAELIQFEHARDIALLDSGAADHVFAFQKKTFHSSSPLAPSGIKRRKDAARRLLPRALRQ